MSYETYRLIFTVGAAAAALMLIAAVILFFVLKIPRVIGELSGRTARKAIEGIRSQTEQGGDKDRKPAAGKTQKKPAQKSGSGARSDDHMSTQKLAGSGDTKPAAAPQAASETVLLAPTAPETAILSQQSSETVLLTPESNETTLLRPEENLTTILAPAMGETAQLNPADLPPAAGIPQAAAIPQPVPQPAAQPVPPAFVIEYELTYIHTGEYIA